MKNNWFRLGFATCSLVALGVLTSLTAAGCGDDDDKGGSGAAGSTNGAAGSASLGPCFPTDPSCGYTGTECLSKVDQTDQPKKLLRMSQLQVSKPKQLATAAIQDLVLHPGVTLPEEACYQLNGKGTFNWLFEFDLANQKGRTGGAKPIPADKLDEGYCFVSETIAGTGIAVAPTTVDLNVTDNKDGTYDFTTKTPIARVVVPIYLDTELTKPPILLPLNDVHLTGGKLSESGNCIGRFRGKTGELDPDVDCSPDSDFTSPGYFSYVNGATLAGTIKIDEADKVIIVDLNNVSLCAYIASLPSDQKSCGANNAKALAAAIDTDGDGTPDSFELEAQFAASGTKFSTADGNCK